jgi:hypothetical protein
MNIKQLRRRAARNLRSFLGFLRHPWAHLTHRLRYKVLARPGSLGFYGGIFNPGAVRTDAGDIVLLAKGQLQHWLNADHATYMRGSPVMLALTGELRIRHAEPVSVSLSSPPYADTEVEDFRLFNFDGHIWANHNLIEVVRGNREPGYGGSQVCLSQFDPREKTLQFLGIPKVDIPTQKREKNWVFVETMGQLYLFYSFRPYVVLKLTDRRTLSFQTCVTQDNNIDFPTLGGTSSPISYSTNPVCYDAQHLLVLVHQSHHRPGGREYKHWGVLLDKTTLAPVRVTRLPLLSGVGARGKLRGTLYATSIIKLGEQFVCFNGEGDSYCTFTTIPKARIDRLWTSISIPPTGVDRRPRQSPLLDMPATTLSAR